MPFDFSGADKVFVHDCLFQGPQSGIRVRHASEVSIQNSVFDNVVTPIDLGGVGNGHIRGNSVIRDPKIEGTGRGAPASGWRRPNGPPLPIFCSKCKHISPSNNYVFGGAFFNCWDDGEEGPHCESFVALLSEGIFNLASEFVEIVSAPDTTYAMLLALGRLQNAVLDSKISEAEAISKAEKQFPAMGKLWRTAAAICVTALPFVFEMTHIYLGVAELGLHRKEVDVLEQQTALMRAQQAAGQVDPAASQKILEQLLAALARVQITPLKAGNVQSAASASAAPYPKSKPIHNSK